jgi:hypothetical protein
MVDKKQVLTMEDEEAILLTQLERNIDEPDDVSKKESIFFV